MKQGSVRNSFALGILISSYSVLYPMWGLYRGQKIEAPAMLKRELAPEQQKMEQAKNILSDMYHRIMVKQISEPYDKQKFTALIKSVAQTMETISQTIPPQVFDIRNILKDIDIKHAESLINPKILPDRIAHLKSYNDELETLLANYGLFDVFDIKVTEGYRTKTLMEKLNVNDASLQIFSKYIRGIHDVVRQRIGYLDGTGEHKRFDSLIGYVQTKFNRGDVPSSTMQDNMERFTTLVQAGGLAGRIDPKVVSNSLFAEYINKKIDNAILKEREWNPMLIQLSPIYGKLRLPIFFGSTPEQIAYSKALMIKEIINAIDDLISKPFGNNDLRYVVQKIAFYKEVLGATLEQYTQSGDVTYNFIDDLYRYLKIFIDNPKRTVDAQAIEKKLKNVSREYSLFYIPRSDLVKNLDQDLIALSMGRGH